MSVEITNDAYDTAMNMLVDDPPLDNVESVQEPVDTSEPETPSVPTVDDTEPFTDRVDPNSLPPELAAIYKQMQGDYTRKTQEVAAYRALAEKAGDVDALQKSYDFYQRMDTDPQFAKSVADFIYNRLGDNPNSAPDDTADDDEDEFGFDDNVPSALQKEIEEMRKWREEMENERMLTQMHQMVVQQETAIRQANTHYDDQDIEAIYEIAAAMEVPDLIQAEERYTALQARFAQKFMQSKTVGKPDVPPSNTPFSQEVVRPKNLDEATKIALEVMLGENGQ